MDPISYRLLLLSLYLSLILLFVYLRKKSFSLPFVFTLSLLLALVRSGQFIAYAVMGIKVYPIEISHISYFLTCGILLSGIPQLQYVGGYFSFLSGLGYFVGAMLSPSSMMSGLGTFEFVLAILSHSLLFFFGLMLLFGTRKYQKRVFLYTACSFALTLLFAFLVKKDILYPGIPKSSYVILKMVDGTLLNYLFPNLVLTDLLKVLTTVFLLLSSFLLALLFYAVNRRIFRTTRLIHSEWGLYYLIKPDFFTTLVKYL